MTRTAVRHTLSALGALALVSAFAAGPAAAQSTGRQSSSCSGISHCGAMGLMQLSPGMAEPKTPKGLATQKGSQAPAEVDSIDMYYSSEGSWGLTTKKPAPHSGDLLDKPTFGEKF